MTLRLLFFFGLSGLLVLEGCGGGDGGGGKKEEKKAFDPAAANPADKVEKGCDPAKVGCCVTRANGGCKNTRCIGTAKENRIWACTANEFAVEKWGKGDNPLIKDTKGCTIDDCEAMCAENKHFPTPDGGKTCIQWIFGKPDSGFDKSCQMYSSCKNGLQEEQRYIAYYPVPKAGATSTGTTAAP